MIVHLWTDGSGTSSGPIGWAWVLRAINDEGEVIAERTGGGFGCEGTNNRAELLAVIEGLRAIVKPTQVTVFTDSEYVARAFTDGYLAEWERNGWRKLTGGAVKNRDLWQQLGGVIARHRVRFEHVPGHTGIDLNERCDRLAGLARRLVKDELARIIEVAEQVAA